jgi:hypothetical protein
MPREGARVKYWLLCRHCRRDRTCVTAAERYTEPISCISGANLVQNAARCTSTVRNKRTAGRAASQVIKRRSSLLQWPRPRHHGERENDGHRIANRFIFVDDEQVVG